MSRYKELQAEIKEALKGAKRGQAVELPTPVNSRRSARIEKETKDERQYLIKGGWEKSEADLQSRCLQYLKSRVDLAYWRISSHGQIVHVNATEAFMASGMINGFPDLLVLKDGTFIGIELKKNGGHLSAKQKIQLDSIVKHGGIGCVVVSVEGLQKAIAFGLPDYFVSESLIPVYS